jgi:hypothetical protein
LNGERGRDSRLWRRNASSLKTTASLLWATRGAQLDPSANRSTLWTGGVLSYWRYRDRSIIGSIPALMRCNPAGRFGSSCWAVMGLCTVFDRLLLQHPLPISPRQRQRRIATASWRHGCATGMVRAAQSSGLVSTREASRRC